MKYTIVFDTDTGTVTATPEGSATPAAPVEPPKVYPSVEVIDGVTVRLLAAVNPQWRYGLSARKWFNPLTGFVAPDPSNGNEGTPPQPLRSPKGFPLKYTFDPSTGEVIGTATVTYEDHGFNNDDEVLDYIAAVAKSAAGAAERDKASGAVWISNTPPAATPPAAGGETEVSIG